MTCLVPWGCDHKHSSGRYRHGGFAIGSSEGGVVCAAQKRVTQIDLGSSVTVQTDRHRMRPTRLLSLPVLGRRNCWQMWASICRWHLPWLRSRPPSAPGLVDRPGIAEWSPSGEAGYYGHPVPGIGYKIAYDAGASGWEPDVEEWEPIPEEERQLLRWLSKRMPAVPHTISRTQRHPWTMTPDVDFIVDRKDQLIVAGGGCRTRLQIRTRGWPLGCGRRRRRCCT